MKNRFLILVASLACLSGTAIAEQVQNVAASAQGSDSVQITWDALPDTAYYDIYENSIERIATGVTDTTYLRSELSAGTTYQYFVTACDTAGVCGEASLQASATTAAGQSSSSGPTATYTDNGDGTALLEWTSVDAADGYNIFLNGEYADTIYNALSSTVAFAAGDEYQVAWFGGGNFPAKSAVATEAGGTITPMPADDTFAAVDSATAGSTTDVEIYFTRHAEKMTELNELENGNFEEVCGDSKCSEILNPAGAARAALLVGAFADAGITNRLTHAFSSHKTRTRQTIEAIVAAAGLTGDIDKNSGDGIQEYPILNDDGTANATELDPQSTSGSEQPTIDALLALPAGSVALVAGHSGTLYDIMAGLGLTDVCLTGTVDTCNQARYPIDDAAKVRDFGDIWKVVLQDGSASFAYRVNLQPKALELNNLAK